MRVNRDRKWKNTGKAKAETEKIDEKYTYPGTTSWQWGGAFEPVANLTTALTVTNIKGSPPTLSVGAEYWVSILAIRAGIENLQVYQRSSSSAIWNETKFKGKYTFGIGIGFPVAKVDVVQLDYALTVEPLVSKHRVSLTFRLP